jgi:hypothetical protein
MQVLMLCELRWTSLLLYVEEGEAEVVWERRSTVTRRRWWTTAAIVVL